MKNKLKVFSVLLLTSMWLTACDNENALPDPQQIPKNVKGVYTSSDLNDETLALLNAAAGHGRVRYKGVYTRSDLDDETWAEINAAYKRGHARYVAAQKKLQQADSVQNAKKLQDSQFRKSNER